MGSFPYVCFYLLVTSCMVVSTSSFAQTTRNEHQGDKIMLPTHPYPISQVLDNAIASTWDMLPHELRQLVWDLRRRLMAIDLLERELVAFANSCRVWPCGVDPWRPHLPRTLRHVRAWLTEDENASSPSSSSWVDELCHVHALFDVRCQVCHVAFRPQPPPFHPFARSQFCSLACYEHV